jgi:hypothetical protein
MGHLPPCFSAITEWTGHVQIESRRTATSAILQTGQFPFSVSNTSMCLVPSGMTTPFIGHAHEIGGSSISAADLGFCRAVIEAGIEPSMTTTAADSRASLDGMRPQKVQGSLRRGDAGGARETLSCYRCWGI